MKIRNKEMKISLLALAVQGALIAMFALPLVAHAADDENEDVAVLKRPTNSVEIGVGNVSRTSAKFGEYTGLDKSGADLIGNFDIRGGNAYDGGDGTTRWRISGSDLGTTSRSLGGSVSNQGQWTIGIGYDELRHNISDTYQTPQQGVMGGNIFTLPPSFGYVASQPVVPVNKATEVSLNATQLGAFHTVDVGTTRKNTSFNAGYNFNPQLSVQFGYNRLKQSGAKLMSSGALGAVATPDGGTWRAEAISILMNPTNYQTDNFDLALNWIGDKGHLTGSYYASSFSNGYDRLTWQNAYKSGAGPFVCAIPPCAQTTTMSTAPANDFHQLNVSGGYAFSSSTKLAGGISYGRNTQNASFLTGLPEIVLAPQLSLNGLVVTRHADLKLTHQATQDLALSAGFKLNERDNRSPANTYQYFALNGNTPVGAATDYVTNAPYSNKKTELELAGDYRLDKRQSFRLAYVHEKISRWCNGMVLPYSNCVVVPSNNENRLGLGYKLRAADGVGFNASYTYAARTALFNHDAVTPLSGLDVPNPHDVNAQDFPGFAAYIYNSRKQHLLKAGVNWQATEKLDLGLTGRYVQDKYDAYLGVQNGRTTGLNLDATYSHAENASFSAYMSWQRGKRDMRSGYTPLKAPGVIVPGNNAGPSYANLVASVAANPLSIWTNQLTDDSNAIGISSKHTGLMNGKLELDGDLSYSFDSTGYVTQLQYIAPGSDLVCTPANLTYCGALPDFKSRLLTLKLTGNYQLNKSDKLGLGLVHQKLTADDYFYNAYQYGSAPQRIMPTNQQSGSYSVNVVAVSYIHTFR